MRPIRRKVTLPNFSQSNTVEASSQFISSSESRDSLLPRDEEAQQITPSWLHETASMCPLALLIGTDRNASFPL